MYAFTQAATATILLLAANTAYNDFPRVLFLMARDFYAPRVFLRMGDRLAFSNGILVLSIAAAAIYAAFGGKTDPLIPLFAVGVFLAFTMSQAGMVVHWWRRRDLHWRRSLAINATGGALSAIVFLTAATTKFTEGAWVALLAVALCILVASRIRHHYNIVGREIALRPDPGDISTPKPHAHPRPPQATATRENDHTPRANEPDTETGAEAKLTIEQIHHLIVVAIAALDAPSMRALAYAASLHQPVLALHVSPAHEDAQRFRGYWDTWGDHLPLEVLVSPYRAIIAPMINYIESLHRQRPDLTITVIVPEIVVRHWWHRLLHNQIAPRLRRALRPLQKIVITTIPFHVSS
jgi:amino acid transporter